MSGKVLPPGAYAVRLLAIGAATVDGGVLISRWSTPTTPCLVADAVRKAVDVCLPKTIELVPAGAWWLVCLEYQPNSILGAVLAEQLLVEADLGRDEFRGDVLARMPGLVETMAVRLVELIGIQPIVFHPGDGQRPSRLN